MLGFLGLGINAHLRLLFNHEVNQKKKVRKRFNGHQLAMGRRKWIGIECEEKNKLPVSDVCVVGWGQGGRWYAVHIWWWVRGIGLACKLHTQTGSFVHRYWDFWRALLSHRKDGRWTRKLTSQFRKLFLPAFCGSQGYGPQITWTYWGWQESNWRTWGSMEGRLF